MVELIVGNGFTQVHCNSWEERTSITRALEFKKRVNMRQWKTDSFFRPNDAAFLSGFKDRVLRGLDKDGVAYSVKYANQPTLPPPGPYDLAGIELRDYQEESVQKILEAKRGVAFLATGAGKTEIAAAVIKSVNQPTLFLTHRKNLMRQTYRRFCKRIPHMADQIGMIGDGVKEPRMITIAMVQTLSGMLKGAKAKETLAFLASVRVLFMDEAHRSSSKSFSTCAMKCPNALYRIGLTATPFMHESQESNLMLEGLTGDVIAKVTATELIERGYLARPMVRFIKITEPDLNQLTDWRDAYSAGIVTNTVRNQLVVKNAVSLVGMGKKTLIIVVEKDHGRALDSMLHEAGIKSAYVDGDDNTDERERAIASLSDDSLDCIVCTNIFDEGVDTDCIGGVILAGGTKAAPALFQRAGRAMRKKDDDQNYCVVIDFIDMTNNTLYSHSLRRYELVKSEPGFRIF